ncbi:MAG: diguanylate cyclase/phosphodiesterase (GGDEF & EAL domains) with PAS/PAC sensor(s) [uncultured Craurococcus sp.]|uniref:Diguanylate cyclase/phosphodiesterase (GGDEF & EAL domains) with PAS/PAC sensor(S) n=1 Tax=uncultured Craurococcus sp. TaxID=1135998 RepID=A0A6J4HFU9_9PROT|nr:MAG: diguanylate cyclase/phosphodiesterase (GGDEF & EAL domains) with PAS/PAC sensor(s) [uncultured Craurococcus sp.]
MPFSSANLVALIQGSTFTLWQYRTADSRALVTAAGYFAAVAGSLRAGDLMVLQTSDSMALLPVRSGPTLGTGVTLDGAVGPINTARSVAQRFGIGQAAAAVVRTIILAPFAAGIVAGTSIPVSATVLGPVSQVVFSLRDGSGAILPPVQVVPVVGGGASASFPTPAIGTGYRIRVEDAADPALGVLSPSFNVGPDLKLILTEGDGRLLSEAGSVLRQ